MGKKIILHESQLKRLIQHQSKVKLNEGITFNDEEQMKDELNLDVEGGKFVDGKDEKPYNPIDDAHSENETASDRMYNSDEWVKAQQDAMEEDSISLNEGQLKLKDTFNKLTGNPIIKSLSSEILKKK
jgi:hypothetical protein